MKTAQILRKESLLQRYSGTVMFAIWCATLIALRYYMGAPTC